MCTSSYMGHLKRYDTLWGECSFYVGTAWERDRFPWMTPNSSVWNVWLTWGNIWVCVCVCVCVRMCGWEAVCGLGCVGDILYVQMPSVEDITRPWGNQRKNNMLRILWSCKLDQNWPEDHSRDNFTVQIPILTKLNMFDKSLALKTYANIQS